MVGDVVDRSDIQALVGLVAGGYVPPRLKKLLETGPASVVEWVTGEAGACEGDALKSFALLGVADPVFRAELLVRSLAGVLGAAGVDRALPDRLRVEHSSLIDDEFWFMMQEALQSLPVAALHGLSPWMGHAEWAIRAACCRALYLWSGPDRLGIVSGALRIGLQTRLTDEDDRVAGDAAWVLSLCAPRSQNWLFALEPTIRLLTLRHSPYCRAAGTVALAVALGDEVVCELLEGLRDPHPWVRTAALFGVHLVAPERAGVEAARVLKEEPEDCVRSWADIALRRRPGDGP